MCSWPRCGSRAPTVPGPIRVPRAGVRSRTGSRRRAIVRCTSPRPIRRSSWKTSRPSRARRMRASAMCWTSRASSTRTVHCVGMFRRACGWSCGLGSRSAITPTFRPPVTTGRALPWTCLMPARFHAIGTRWSNRCWPTPGRWPAACSAICTPTVGKSNRSTGRRLCVRSSASGAATTCCPICRCWPVESSTAATPATASCTTSAGRSAIWPSTITIACSAIGPIGTEWRFIPNRVGRMPCPSTPSNAWASTTCLCPNSGPGRGAIVSAIRIVSSSSSPPRPRTPTAASWSPPRALRPLARIGRRRSGII